MGGMGGASEDHCSLGRNIPRQIFFVYQSWLSWYRKGFRHRTFKLEESVQSICPTFSEFCFVCPKSLEKKFKTTTETSHVRFSRPKRHMVQIRNVSDKRINGDIVDKSDIVVEEYMRYVLGIR